MCSKAMNIEWQQSIGWITDHLIKFIRSANELDQIFKLDFLIRSDQIIFQETHEWFGLHTDYLSDHDGNIENSELLRAGSGNGMKNFREMN